MLTELYLYQQCRKFRTYYERNIELYKKVFGSGLIKKPPFKNLVQGLRYGEQARTVVDTLFAQFVPDSLKARWGLVGMAKLLTILDENNALFPVSEKQYNGTEWNYTKRAAELPVFSQMRFWLSAAEDKDWDTAFAIRFRLSETYEKIKDKEKFKYSYSSRESYLQMSDFVQCFVRGIWDKDLFYKGVFTFLNLGNTPL